MGFQLPSRCSVAERIGQKVAARASSRPGRQCSQAGEGSTGFVSVVAPTVPLPPDTARIGGGALRGLSGHGHLADIDRRHPSPAIARKEELRRTRTVSVI